MKKYILILAGSTLFAGAQEMTLEQRVALLERKVAELEAKDSRVPEKPTLQKPVTGELAQGIIFSDDFEKGIQKWKEHVQTYPAYKNALQGVGKEVAHKNGKVVKHSKWRVTKKVIYDGKSIVPAEGKRFVTASNFEDGIAKMTSTMPSGWVESWQGARYFYMEKPLDLSKLSLPIAQFKANFDPPAKSHNRRMAKGVFQVGYVYENQDVAEFTPLMTLTKKSDGWQDYEVGLSEVDKSKKIKLVFMYASGDHRKSWSSGLHLDDVVVKDDK